MSINRYGGIFDRLKRTLEFLRSPGEIRHGVRRAAPVLKLNIAPLMGRRDAAVDRAADFISSDIFSLHNEKRIDLYSRTCLLLELAGDDCDRIISGLSSADTIKRERHLRSFISILHSTMVTIRNVAALENVILVDTPDVLKEFAVSESGTRLEESEKVMTGTEINLVNRLRDYFDRTRPRLARYREYATKNFSPVYAEKYTNAYKSYFDVYGQEDF